MFRLYVCVSWLIKYYMECDPNFQFICPSADQKQAVQECINRGEITWHAFPFNSEAELHSIDLFTHAMTMTATLATRFNRSGTGAPPNTISQRDVPGTTRAVIPIMKANGVKAFTIGANGASAPVGVPPAFIWQDVESGESIYAMYHAGGYGDIGIADAATIPGWNATILWNWATDNMGPSDAQSYLNDLTTIRNEFPGKKVMVATVDQFVNDLDVAIAAKVASLPIITDEMGDTWIYGIASDPLKMSQLRAIQRLRTACVADTTCDSTSEAFQNFSSLLVKGFEHTWGACVGCSLGGADINNYDRNAPYTQWTNAEFGVVMRTGWFQFMNESWVEQRTFCH